MTPYPSVWRQIHNPDDVEIQLKREGIKRIQTDHRWRCLARNRFNCWNRGLGWVMGGVCRIIARRLGFDSGIGWIMAAEQACSAVSKGDVDLILATASPFSAFGLARKLAERLGCSYVLDYRDPWTQNPHRSGATQPSLVQKEAQLLAGSAAVTIVSPSWGETLHRQHLIGEKLHVITNGYDPEELFGVEPVSFGHFAIVYAGVFYPPKRVITPVMRALKRLKDNFGSRVEECFFHYYGPHQEHVREEAKRADVMEHVVFHGEVPRPEALSAVRGASVAVVITSVSDEASNGEQGIVTSKIFEAVGLRVPTLLVCPSGSDAETVLRETGLGRAFTGSDIDGMSAFLWDLMSGRGVKSGNLAEYSWANIAKKLDGILQGVLENEGKGGEKANVAGYNAGPQSPRY